MRTRFMRSILPSGSVCFATAPGDAFRKGRGTREKELENEREKLLKQLGQDQVEKAFLEKKAGSWV